ncbi:HAD family hydrolase [Acetobacteraceae bacterium ESL0709]|nr:HAD family hydrolase [Acetobacteraceae bacterium ESL0697]MDF7677653.1 HAD family hydrolase [Acetobacteraceae bacterium ESL0709]
MSSYELLLIDYDGTMAETRPAILKGLSEAFRETGHQAPSKEDMAATLGHGGTLADFFHMAVPNATMQDVQDFVRIYRAYYSVADEEDTVLFPDVTETLKQLGEAGFRLVVISNKLSITLTKSLERFGIASFFEAVIGAEEGKARKPDPALYRERLQPLYPQIEPGNMLMVGDTLADLQFAKAAHMASCWASYGHGVEAACLAEKPDCQIRHFSELPALLGC